MNKKSYAPIVLFVYNRSEHTCNTVQALQKNDLARESELFIYSDGPKDDPHSKDKVAEVRAFIKTITGFKKTTIVESEQNKGLAESVIQGVTDIVDRYGRVIVLEDDLKTSPDFLRFMNEALDRYEDEPQVMQISGHMFDVKIKADTDAVFLPFVTSWGWAIWKRSWDCFDPSLSNYTKIKNDKQLMHRFNLDGAYNYFNILDSQFHGKIDSWAILWYLSVFFQNGLVLYPINSFVLNIGFDGSGTHCGVASSERGEPSFSSFARKIFRFPKVRIDQEAYTNVKLFLSARGTSRSKGKSILRRETFLTRLGHFFSS